jgi:hypothetical protein
MKKYFFLSLAICISSFLKAQEAFPSMKGYWYSKGSNEMFVISTDSDQSVKGRGVLYSNGNGRFVTMQIMSQTQKEVNGQQVYWMRVYNPATPKKVFEIISKQGDGRVHLDVTLTGARDQILTFYDLKDLHE